MLCDFAECGVSSAFPRKRAWTWTVPLTDRGTIMRQLGVAHDPDTLGGRLATVANHPLTIGRALARQVTRR